MLNEHSGIINLCKPAGVGSSDCVELIKRFFQIKKVGHGGTLDPFADGVLPIGINRGTKMLQSYSDGQKEYTGHFCIGVATDTLDMEGDIVGRMPEPWLPEQSWFDDVAKLFLGEMIQETPLFSARRVGGKRLYELARKGKTPDEIPKKRVEIFSLSFNVVNMDKVCFRVVCSKGTYIRQLIKDVLSKAELIGTLDKLTRVKVGFAHLNDAITVEELLKFDQNAAEPGIWFNRYEK